jgi:predicted Zn-dependent protease
MLTRDQAERITQAAIRTATFPECTVGLTSYEHAYARFANNGITAAALTMRYVVQITVARDGQVGSTVTNDLHDHALRAAVKRAEELAAIAPANPERLPDLGPQRYPDMPPCDSATAAARPAQLVPHVQAAISAARAHKLVGAGLVDRTHRIAAISNKAGLFGFHAVADSALTVTVRTPDGSSSGWAGQPSTRLSDIDSRGAMEAAVGKCVRWKNPRRIDPGRYTVVLEPAAAGDLVRLMGPSFSARDSEEGRTFLSKRGGGTKLDEALFPDFVTLRTDPFDPRLPSLPWTRDLLPARAVTWVDRGVVKELFHDRYWAQKSNMQAGQYPFHMIMDGGPGELKDLIAGVEHGLLVTRLWYIRAVNSQTLQHTGLTRDGLFLIENGEVAAPVMNLRFNESPVRLLQNAVRIGRAIRVRGPEGGLAIAPPIVATDFTFTSVSDAI